MFEGHPPDLPPQVPPPREPLVPRIKPPEPRIVHFGSATPDAGEQWRFDLADNAFINPRFGEIKTPPKTPDQFDAWVDQTVTQIAQTQEGNREAFHLDERENPGAQAALLFRYADALSNWHRAEYGGNNLLATYYFGRAEAYQELLQAGNLGSDAQFLRDTFLKFPQVGRSQYMERRRRIR